MGDILKAAYLEKQLEDERREKMTEDTLTQNNQMFYFMNRARLQKQIEREFGYTPKPEPIKEKPKKEPRWFVIVEEGWECGQIHSFHTKKEALDELKYQKKMRESCYLIKGKIVKK